MTQRSIHEYAVALRERYQQATRKGKQAILDEFCRTTGYHRKAAIRLLGGRTRKGSGGRKGRPPRFSVEVVEAVRLLWEASDRLGSKRLAPFLAELVAVLERHGELRLPLDVREQVVGLSAATIDRLLRPWRQVHRHQPLRQRRALSAVQAQVPVRTWSEWAGVAPGAGQADLVFHSGESLEGFHLTTLTVIDVATAWTGLQAVWGKGQTRVRGAIDAVRRRWPLPLTGLHTDNGGEFLNAMVAPYCRQHGIALSRGRPYHKNDQAYVEQRNWSVVRRYVGYDRYASQAAYQQLQGVYRLLERYVNFFQPVRKLVAKQRVGARLTKRYDAARTPYQRLLAAGVLTAEQETALRQQYERLNPVRLRAEIEAGLEALWRLAARPGALGKSLREVR